MFFLISDKVWFIVFESVLLAISIWSFLRVTVFIENSVVSGVSRGAESRSFMLEIASVFLTVVISVIFTITTFPHDAKVLLYVLNVFLILYLCMWNGWSTNKLIGLKNKFATRNFNPHRQ